MNAIATPAVTPDDLLRMPNRGKGYELVDGRLKELNVSFLSSFVAGEVFAALRDFVKPRQLGWVVPEGTSFQCFPDDATRVRRADSAFLALDRLTSAQATTEGHCRVCPDLVVEVISPNDLAADLNRKVEEWLAAGVRLVWVIDPEAQIVYCHQPGEMATIRRRVDTLTADPVLPGFSHPVADLFRLPSRPA